MTTNIDISTGEREWTSFEEPIHSLVIVVVIARVDDLLSLLGLLLAPVVGALSAHKDQVHPVLSRVHECHCLRVTATAADDVFTARESRVLDTFLVNMEEELRSLAGGAAALGS